MSIPVRRTANPLFGKPVLVAANNGRVSWGKNTSLSQFQKGTGWQAELYGGAQTGDDWAACYIPVDEIFVSDFKAALWSWYQTNAETMGLGMVIWIHDPKDLDKRAEVTQLANVSGLDKGAGWNSHEWDTSTVQMFYYGENTTGAGLTEGTQYAWTSFQTDALFKNWTIYRISFDWGWEASGTFETAYLAEAKLNGVTVSIKPDETESIMVPLAVASQHGVAETANTDILASDITPTNTPSLFRIMVMLETAGVFSAILKSGGVSKTLKMNAGNSLLASCAYMFDILVHSGDTVNFQTATSGNVTLRGQEIVGGVQ